MPAEPESREVPLTSEEDIRRGTVGPVVFHNAPIVLVAYDPRWPAMFDREAKRIRAALASLAIRVEHVGSTSVPGLAAKPIIDMVLEVADSSDEPAYVSDLEVAGYRLTIREPEWFEHRLLKGPVININLHVFSAGCEETARMVRFRDWLRSHAEDRERYEAVKRDLSQQDWKYVQQYADAKSSIVTEIMARANAVS